jgi:hypothetical protein
MTLVCPNPGCKKPIEVPDFNVGKRLQCSACQAGLMVVICPNEQCRKKLPVPEKAFGKKGKCSACGTTIQAVVPVAEQPAERAAQSAPFGSAPRREQFNEELRKFYSSLGVRNDLFAECQGCKLLLPTEDTLNASIMIMGMMQRSSGPLAAFITLMRGIFGEENVSSPTDIPSAMSFLGQFVLQRCEHCHKLLCMHCVKGRTQAPRCILCE